MSTHVERRLTTRAPWAGELVLVVSGEPAPQGSKSAKGRTRSGRTILVESSKKVAPWRLAVANAATALIASLGAEWTPADRPVRVRMVFTLRRPAKPKFSDAPAVPPDLDKLARSTLDALTGVLWRDDSRVVEFDRLAKVYVGSDDPEALLAPGCSITVKGADHVQQ